MPVGLHPFLAADLPGACLGLRINRLRTSSNPLPDDTGTVAIDNIFFTQAIANPFDMMCSMTFLLAGGVCERFPDLRLVFLEAGGGWLVPWLERLDHHYEIFGWDVPNLTKEPSEYFRRQCWISFDPDESTLAFTAQSPLCGADRIVWASDYPHPDAVFPGVTRELSRSHRRVVGTRPASDRWCQRRRPVRTSGRPQSHPIRSRPLTAEGSAAVPRGPARRGRGGLCARR